MSFFHHTLRELQDLLCQKKISAVDLMQSVFQHISKSENDVNAYITIDEEQAMTQAKHLDSIPMAGKLHGIPIGIKDNISVQGMRMTCASKFLENFSPVYEATVSARLKNENAIILGKCNMDEFAMGGSNENSAYGPTKNPWNLAHVPGGSSGGSAAAVAAHEAFFTLGSDTGGSIRQPASYCGVVGLKPTYGRVSRYGLTAFASSLDQIGPITTSVEDAAYVMSIIAGNDVYDATSAKQEVAPYNELMQQGVKGMRIGIPKEYLGEGIHIEVKEAIQNAIRVFESLGANCEEVSLPHTPYALATYYLISSAEASSNLSRFDGIRYGKQSGQAQDLLELYKKSRSEGFGPEVKRRIMLGTYALSSGYYDAFYLKAQKVRTLIREDFNKVFTQVDMLLGPTAPTTAFKLNEQMNDPLTMYLNDVLTIPINLAGVPAMSIPCGLDKHNLPIGLQLIGKHFSEHTLFQAGHAFEQFVSFEKLCKEANRK